MSIFAFIKALKPKIRRRLWRALVLSLAGGFTALIIAVTQPFYTFNLWFSDRLIESEALSSNIVIVGIDDDTLKTYGKWSEWPRSLHAQAVSNLSAAGASAIGFDILFAENSADDAVFSEAIKKADNVVLGAAGTTRLVENDEKVRFTDFILPADELRQSSPGVGHVNIVPDPDGKIRRLPLIVQQTEAVSYPSLSLVLLHAHFHKPLPDRFSISDGRLSLLSREIPVDDSYGMRINFTEQDEGLNYIPYADVITGKFDFSSVRNKIVLIGMTATGETDSVAVPNSSVRVPGVFIHAAAIDTILRTRFLNEADSNTTILIIFLLIAICAMVLPFTGTLSWTDVLKETVFIGALFFGYLLICVLASERGYILNVLYPSITLAVLYLSDILYVVMRGQADNRFVKDLFGRYVSPQISREIIDLATNGNLTLGGEEKEVTVMFADIRNFTTLSERMTPDAVVKMLNTCLPIMIDAIVRNEGLVNKFAGDNLMGVWNTPRSNPDHPVLAVKAAWEAQKQMAELSKSNPELKDVQFGIGINTGKAVAGNVGSAGRVEYTVIGDAVNLASRICSVALGGEILIGPDTCKKTDGRLEVDSLKPQMFKGKSEPVVVYRVKGWRDNSN